MKTIDLCLANILDGKYQDSVNDSWSSTHKSSSKEYQLLKIYFRDVSIERKLIEKPVIKDEKIGRKKI